MKRRIRLTEGDLRRIVNKSVRRALSESNYFLTNGDGSKYALRMHNSREGMGFYPNYEDEENKSNGKLDVEKIMYDADGKYQGVSDKMVTLDDLSPEELQYLLNRYKGEYGGAPGSRGVLMAWAEYWRKALNDYVNKKS